MVKNTMHYHNTTESKQGQCGIYIVLERKNITTDKHGTSVKYSTEIRGMYNELLKTVSLPLISCGWFSIQTEEMIKKFL
ncbi:hypothetical protein LCGC14_1783700 [marine sediment metagenome]|uniref:Uncharacterized protein n=1 Tax=marine sediment metagenome TaxID=412755 RepID=A0A0F9J9J5_9ZZZZ